MQFFRRGSNVRGIWLLALASVFVLCVYASPTSAAFPHILPFSARLTAASGGSVPSGTYSITFKIYSEESGGSPLWSETLSIPVTEGLVSTNLGETTPIPSSLTFNEGTHYLGVSVGSDSEMTPRRPITAVPLALNAATLDGATPGTGAGNILQLNSEGGFSLAGPLLTTSSLQGGSTTITGTLTTTGGATLGSTLQVASSASIGSSLTVQGAASIGGNLSLSGNLIPTTSGSSDLGSSSHPFNSAYINNLVVGTVSTSGTSNSSFTINQLATSDQDAALNFYRGGSLPSAQILWNAASQRFDINQNVRVGGDLMTSGGLEVAGHTVTGTSITNGGGSVSVQSDGSTAIVGSIRIEGNINVPGGGIVVATHMMTKSYFGIQAGGYVQRAGTDGNGWVFKGSGGGTFSGLWFNTTTADDLLLKPVGTQLQVRLADDSDYGSLVAGEGIFTQDLQVVDGSYTNPSIRFSGTNTGFSRTTSGGIYVSLNGARHSIFRETGQFLLLSAGSALFPTVGFDGVGIHGGSGNFGISTGNTTRLWARSNGTIEIPHLGSATNDSTQAALLIKPPAAPLANYQALRLEPYDKTSAYFVLEKNGTAWFGGDPDIKSNAKTKIGPKNLTFYEWNSTDTIRGIGGLTVSPTLITLFAGTTGDVELGTRGASQFYLDQSTGNVGIGISPTYKFHVDGDINSSIALKVAGTTVCTSVGCTASANSGSYIQNGTSPQTADFNISGNGTIGGSLAVTGMITANGGISSPGTGANSEVFGAGASAGSYNGVSIGKNTSSDGTGSQSGQIVIGYGASATGAIWLDKSIVIGYQATSGAGGGVVVIGGNAGGASHGGTVVGNAASGGNGQNNTVIGSNAKVLSGQGYYSTVVGAEASVGGGWNTPKTALGYAASVQGNYALGLGVNVTIPPGATGSIALGSGVMVTAANQLVAGSSSNPINSIFFGKGVFNATPTAYTIQGTGGLGAGVAGADIQLAGGIAGDAATAGGDIILKTAAAGTGTTLTERLRVTAAGNVGISTADPKQKLEVNGGIRLNTDDVKPSCDADSRGTFWVTKGDTGVKDTVEVCAKDAADSYAWRAIY